MMAIISSIVAATPPTIPSTETAKNSYSILGGWIITIGRGQQGFCFGTNSYVILPAYTNYLLYKKLYQNNPCAGTLFEHVYQEIEFHSRC